MKRKITQASLITVAVFLGAVSAQAADTWPVADTDARPSLHADQITWPCPGYPVPVLVAAK